jgi:hypothetical protein
MTQRLFATDQFIAPAYGGGSFADIPGLIRAKLTGGAPRSSLRTAAAWPRATTRWSSSLSTRSAGASWNAFRITRSCAASWTTAAPRG